MANLSEQQKQAVAQWATEGATLNDIQSRLKDELGVTLTYFDTRLLVLEMGLTLRDKKKEEAEKAAAKKAEPEILPAEDKLEEELTEDDYALPEPPPGDGGNVQVSLDTLTVPGAMVSGKVTFSDGTDVGWQLDQYGRLGLRDAPMGYQPPPQDIASFQQQLQKLLQ